MLVDFKSWEALMKELDFRKQAEQMVNKFYISDPEWREILIETYIEILSHHDKKPIMDSLDKDQYLLPI